MHHPPRRNGHKGPEPVSHPTPRMKTLMTFAESLRHDVRQNIGRLQKTQTQSRRLVAEFNERHERDALATPANATFPLLM